MARLTLYVKEGCHLCDEAGALLHGAGLLANTRKVDISRDTALLERYAWQIPVLADSETGQELQWPFTLADLQRLA